MRNMAGTSLTLCHNGVWTTLTTVAHARAPQFVRDRFTWLAYAMLAYFSYMQAVLGPLVPFLRARMQLSYTVAGMHLSALAVGAIFSGIVAERVMRRWGRRRVLWTGGAGMTLGGAMLAAAPSPLVTISGAFLIGWLGVFVMIVSQAGLSDHHRAARPVALAEGNLAASFVASLAPLLVGGSVAVGIGWQSAVLVACLVWAVLWLVAGRDPVPDTRRSSSQLSRAAESPAETLPARFWAFWAIMLMLVAVHWSTGMWSAEFMENVVGFDKVTASTLAWVFLSAIIVGRAAGMWLVRFVPEERVLLGSLLVALAGFPVFWLARSAPLNVGGLFIFGLGAGNFYSMGLALAIGTAPAIADAASARVSVGAGLAMLVVPQMLGTTADVYGLRVAFGIVFVVLLLALGSFGVIIRGYGIGTAHRQQADG